LISERKGTDPIGSTWRRAVLSADARLLVLGCVNAVWCKYIRVYMAADSFWPPCYTWTYVVRRQKRVWYLHGTLL